MENIVLLLTGVFRRVFCGVLVLTAFLCLFTFSAGAAPPSPLLSRIVFDVPQPEPQVAELPSPRYYYCARTTQPPVIDGTLDDACWKTTLPAGDFKRFGREKPVSRQTIVRVLFDDANLYVAYECLEDKLDAVMAAITERDIDKIWRDDSVELFLDPSRNRKYFYQWILNSLGTLWDARCVIKHALGAEVPVVKNELNWNSGAKVKSGRDTDRWIVEARIPFKAMNVPLPAEGDVWGVNFNRHRIVMPENSNWAGLSGKRGNLDPEGFGNLVFGDPRAFIEQWHPGTSLIGTNIVDVQVRNCTDKRFKVKLTLGLNNAPAAESRFTIPANDVGMGTLKYTIASLDSGRLDLSLFDAKKKQCLGNETFSFTPPPVVLCRPSGKKFTANAKEARVFITLFVGPLSLSGTRITVKLTGVDGKVVREQAASPLKSSRLTGYLDLSGLRIGKYLLACEVTDKSGRMLGRAENTIEIIADPFDF